MQLIEDTPPEGATRASQVYSDIKNAIMVLQLRPGSVVQEEALAKRFGVSRTPVREALRRLEQDGLVRTIPKKGVLVTGVSAQDILEIFQVRMAVEPLAARLAANQMPLEEIRRLRELHVPATRPEAGVNRSYRELHRSIARHCGNSRLSSILRSLMDETTRILAMSGPAETSRQCDQHLEIIKALEIRDGLAAEQAMQEHLLDFRRSFISLLVQHDDPVIWRSRDDSRG